MLNRADSNKWIVNTLIFLRPVILIYLGFVSTNIGAHGLVPEELVPNAFVSGAMVLYLVNVFTDYLRKLDAQTEEAVEKIVVPPQPSNLPQEVATPSTL